jgi:hypothetical protein
MAYIDRGNDVKAKGSLEDPRPVDPRLSEMCGTLEHTYHLMGAFSHLEYPGNAMMCLTDPKLIGPACVMFREFAGLYNSNFTDSCECRNPDHEKNEGYTNVYAVRGITYNYRAGIYYIYTSMTYNRWCQVMNFIERK